MFNKFQFVLFMTLAIVCFVRAAIPSMAQEFQSFRDHQNKMGPLITEIEGVIPTEDLSIVTGEQVVGMVPFAVNGEYVLVVDGITISEGMDLDYISFSGVVGNNYRLSVSTNTSTSVTTVVANVIM